jgi:hypothetical protein
MRYYIYLNGSLSEKNGLFKPTEKIFWIPKKPTELVSPITDSVPFEFPLAKVTLKRILWIKLAVEAVLKGFVVIYQSPPEKP